MSNLTVINNEMTSLLDSVDVGEVTGTLQKISQLQMVVQRSLKSGHDFGNVGGVTKPTLLKPGAEKILMLFGLTSEYEILEKIEDYDKRIFAYTLKCILKKNGSKITEGVGSCNSKEDKYRWRWVNEADVPAILDKDILKVKKSSWGDKYRIENDDICSIANTILKMAKKRAQIDATLTVASLSEIFTQDVEDMQNFVQSESVSTMTLEDALATKITFGKFKGKILAEIFEQKPDYLDWLVQNSQDGVIKKACEIILNDNLNKVTTGANTDEETTF